MLVGKIMVLLKEYTPLSEYTMYKQCPQRGSEGVYFYMSGQDHSSGNLAPQLNPHTPHLNTTKYSPTSIRYRKWIEPVVVADNDFLMHL